MIKRNPVLFFNLLFISAVSLLLTCFVLHHLWGFSLSRGISQALIRLIWGLVWILFAFKSYRFWKWKKHPLLLVAIAAQLAAAFTCAVNINWLGIAGILTFYGLLALYLMELILVAKGQSYLWRPRSLLPVFPLLALFALITLFAPLLMISILFLLLMLRLYIENRYPEIYAYKVEKLKLIASVERFFEEMMLIGLERLWPKLHLAMTKRTRQAGTVNATKALAENDTNAIIFSNTEEYTEQA